MNRPLVYFPAYLGLFAAQLLAMTCNAFLDIRYRSFTFEVTFWAVTLGITLGLAVLQRGTLSGIGKWGQRITMALACFFSLFIFIRLWGFPRAGVAILASLMAVQNCVTVTWRHLHIGLLISATLVLYATSHYRADWSMLFYLVPYVVAVVFTLVAEQINRTVQDLKKYSHARQVAGGQAAAIATATCVILLLGGLIYMLTPQTTWQSKEWRYGQMNTHGQNSGDASSSGGAGGEGSSDGGQGGGQGTIFSLPTPDAMRAVALRPGMPEWQGAAIKLLADGIEWTTNTLAPILQQVKKILKNIKDWVIDNYRLVAFLLLLLVTLLLLYGLWRLLREVKAGMWLLTRFDYLRFGILGLHAQGDAGARQYYGAMERLFALYDLRRRETMNTREYLATLRGNHRYLQRELSEMTRLFEDAWYGPGPSVHARRERMRQVYRQIFRLVEDRVVL